MSPWSSDELEPRYPQDPNQATLFPVPPEKLEVDLQVSVDELHRWHQQGWLSFTPGERSHVDWAEETEIRFVRALARSGLSDEWVSSLLQRLTPPYCYGTDKTFYSFDSESWIGLPDKPAPVDLSTEDVSEYLDYLADEDEWAALRKIRDSINDLLKGEAEDPNGEDDS